MSNIVTVRREGGELVEREISGPPIEAEGVANALGELVAIARDMQPDDLSIDIDAAAGKLHFRAYRRFRPIAPASSPSRD
ncbi:hypothetical protein ACIQUG_03495 [Ensifer sp. NPDC090286]|uniref:hypothetical protein n=1 Tax=Ensifer sp. NPDC090286 TaxID=3363991 RepID=UPI00383BC386